MRKITAVILLLPNVVFAHSGAATSFSTAFFHPLSGLDHLLAMILVGAIACQFSKTNSHILIGTFLVGFLSSAVVTQGVIMDSSMIETALAASLVLLGIVGAMSYFFCSSALIYALIAALIVGIFHGIPHGQELSGVGIVGLLGLGLASLGVTKAVEILSSKVAVLRGISCLMVSGINIVAGISLLSIR